MKKRFILLLSLGLFGCSATWNQEQAEATASKKVLYVAPNGKDTNSGSLKRPLKTLKRASQLAKAGTTVYLRQGTYTEALTVRYSGTKQAPVVFRNYQTEKVVLSGKSVEETGRGDDAHPNRKPAVRDDSRTGCRRHQDDTKR